MRTLVDSPPDQFEMLAELAKRRQMSRTAIIRQAIGEFLSRNAPEERDSAFGLWGRSACDGFKYQRGIRSER